MKFTEAMICWNPDTDEIAVGPWPDYTRWSNKYLASTGACETRLHDMDEAQRGRMLFIHFNTIVVGDSVDVQAAHQAFLEIDEYRQLISPDIEGAEPDEVSP